MKKLRLQSAMLEVTANGIVITDRDGVIQWVNPSFTALTGYSADEAIGKNPRMLKSGVQDKNAYDDLWKTILSGKIWHGEIINRRKDGSLYPEEMTITPVMNETGQVTNFIAIKQDITKRKEAERILSESEMKYRTLFESSRDAIMTVFPPDWKFTSGNPATVSMFGASNEAEFTSLGPWDVSPEYQPDGQLSSVKAAKMIQTAMNKGSHFFEWTHKKINGPDFPATVLLTRIILAGSTGLQATVRDISELEQAEVENKKITQQLMQSEKMAAMGQLASGVAHEINNPLGVILGFAQGMKNRVKENDAFFLPVQSIEREAKRCRELVRELLAFARLDKLESKVCDLNGVIKDALSIVETQTKVRGVELVQNFSAEIPCLSVNSNQIQQVIINLCNNAIDAMDNGGTLTVTTRTPPSDNGDRFVEISVADTGVGIPQKRLSRIFEPFYTTKEVGKGTGLGLSLVYEIVNRHGGMIDVHSELGKGTDFVVMIPVMRSTEKDGSHA